MRLLTTWFSCFAVFTAIAHDSSAQQPIGNAAVGKQRYVLEVDVGYVADLFHQKIVVQEGTSFFVITPFKGAQWTLAGDVGQVVKGHLPVMIKSRCYYDAKSNSTIVMPKLIKLNDNTDRGAGLNHHSLSVKAREATEADELPGSEVMERALRGMISELLQPAVEQDKKR